MPRTRTELLVQEVFIENATWKDLEFLFSLNKNTLLDELRTFFEEFSNGLTRFTCVCDKITSNQQCMHNVEYER